MNRSERWINELEMIEHPEGGCYRESYRSDEVIPLSALPTGYEADHSFSTAIYFLLRRGEFSAFHKIRQDELWHHYDGGGLIIHCISEAGSYSSLKIGTDFASGERPQGVVRAGTYFAAELIDGGIFSLVGCTVAPGFEFADFDLPDRARLLRLFPSHTEIVTRLTRC